MRTIYVLFTAFLCLPALMTSAQECTGTSTDAAEGSFSEGYNYTITTNGDVVSATFQLLDEQEGLVAFAQTYNPDFAEVPMTEVMGENQTFTIDFPGQTAGDTFLIACKFAFAGGLSTSTIISYIVGEGCAEQGGGGVSLPITFEEDIDYELVDFGGNASEIVADPTDASNTVVQTTKGADAQTWAGTTVADVNGFDEPIPFGPDATTMTVRVWSPLADIPVRLKVEQVGVPTISVETEAMVPVAEEWVTLTFDFANEAPGTAELNLNASYEKASIFFNFDTPGSATGEQTYFWDDVDFGSDDPGPDPESVYDIISESPDHTTLTTAINLAELDGVLSGEGTFTVFAPTDEAFAAVPTELLETILDDPAGLLTEVLLFHVLGNTVLSTDITGDVSPETLQGESVDITLDGGNVFVDEAQVTVPDLVADNGVVHVINGVLVPSTVISVGELAADANSMQVYPNPAGEAVTVVHDFAVSERPMVQVYDFGGKLVYQENTLTEGQVRLDVSMLPAGLYLITVSTKDRMAFDKLMIAR